MKTKSAEPVSRRTPGSSRQHGDGDPTFDLDPFAFGAFQSVTFEMDVPQEPNLRPVSSLEVDDSGRIFAASASDPDVDVGPFRSAVWEIGSIELDRDGSPSFRCADRRGAWRSWTD